MNIIETDFKQIQKPINCKWEKITELLIDTSLINEQSLIDETAWEFKKCVDDKALAKFLNIFEEKESRRLEKIKLFMEQTKWNLNTMGKLLTY